MIEKTEEEIVINFFYEHPIHLFTKKQIAEYLDMSEEKLEKYLEKMFLEDKLVKTIQYKASSSFIKEVIYKINKQNKEEK